MDTIDITPTKEGQEQLLALFVDQLVDDIKTTRRMPDRGILRSVIDLAFTAGFNAPRDTTEAMAQRERLTALVR